MIRVRPWLIASPLRTIVVLHVDAAFIARMDQRYRLPDAVRPLDGRRPIEGGIASMQGREVVAPSA